ncbi:MAG: AMP-binding protein [Myxococcales bacterium]|jgi:4-coumarate--CoA ligase (photoactive yellow protein activation family)
MSYLFPPHAPEDLVAVAGASDRTAADLMRDVAAIAAALPPADPPGEILVICQDRYHFTAALLAAWQVGHAVALPPNGQPETVRALSSQPNVRMLLHDTEEGDGLDLRTLLGRADGPRAEPRPIEPERHVATLYTSGSTGSHKPCRKGAAQLLGEAAMLVKAFGLGPGTRVLATVPGHHIYGLLWSVLVPLSAGGSFVRETPFHAETVAARLAATGANLLASVPAHLRGLELLAELPNLERVVSSGAPLPAETARMVRERFGMKVTEIFGSSETGGIAWRDEPERPWEPLPGAAVSADPEGRLLLDSPFLPPEARRPHPCDDRIEMLDEGRFRLLGRLDGVVKIGGKRISLAEIERRLLACEGVKDAAALSVQVQSARGAEIWAAVVAPGRTVAQIKSELRRWLDPVTLPRRIKLVEKLPREENGKLTRSKLQALLDEPVTELEPQAEKRVEKEGAEAWDLEYRIPESLLYFRGHFDGHPILPGVVQLNTLVLAQISRLWPDLGHPRRIVRLKFKKIIEPGALVCLRLERPSGAPRVHFQISDQAGEAAGYASGSFVFA